MTLANLKRLLEHFEKIGNVKGAEEMKKRISRKSPRSTLVLPLASTKKEVKSDGKKSKG